MSATICFCHGRESGPWGTKIRRLAQVAEQFGCRVVSLDDRGILNPEERVQRLLASAAGLSPPLILVGSSMGGYVAAVASAELRPAGLFLLAPAVGLHGYRIQEPPISADQVAIVHGWNDSVVPANNVIEFARRQRVPLHLLDDGHALQDSLDRLSCLFADFLAACLGRSRPVTPPRELIATL